ncbi:MAG TPA: hypothetical protein VMD98_08505 [Bryocella sp.]|nr:hypothetical protein [Bryocella sp.]
MRSRPRREGFSRPARRVRPAIFIEANNGANHARGLDVKIPTTKNRVILSF